MRAIEALRVSEKGAQACFSAEVNGLAMIIGFREISRIAFEYPLTDCVETLERFLHWMLGFTLTIKFYHENIKGN